MLVRTALLLAVVLCSGVAFTASAQIDSSTAGRMRRARAVLLQVRGGERIEGRVDSIARHHLAFRRILRPTVHDAFFVDTLIQVQDLERIWVGRGTYMRPAALGAGATLGLVGALVGLGYKDELACGYGCILQFGAIGAATGLVTGGAVGLIFRRWEVVWTGRMLLPVTRMNATSTAGWERYERM